MRILRECSEKSKYQYNAFLFNNNSYKKQNLQ